MRQLRYTHKRADRLQRNSVCLSFSICIPLSMHVYMYVSGFVSVCLSLSVYHHLSVHLCMSACLSLSWYVFVCLFLSVSVCLSITISISVYLSACLSAFPVSFSSIALPVLCMSFSHSSSPS